MIVTEIEPPTARVATVNVADDSPAGTVTVGGTDTGSLPDSVTGAPLAGAAAVSVTVPVTGLPPTTLAVLSLIVASAAPVVTVSGDDWLLPLTDAVIIAEPGATPVTVIAALVVPLITVTDAGTVATAALLLDNATNVPADGAAAPSVTV
ncbi:MAG TPA: hypothetical protein VHU82_03840, partial [Vicinamibacterales bacterium]|nr:hypothetical protein [Vicinamibacterales bacterium]